MKSEILKKMIKNVSSTTALKVEKIAFNLMIPGLEKEHNIQILLAYVRGSHMYGLATEKSDVDITFVYRQPTEEILRTNYLSQLNIGGNDIVGYEIQRFLELLTLNNPNILEALDIPEDCIIYQHPLMDQKLWLSKLSEKTILGYAQSQIKKATGLKKNMNTPQPKERKSILEFCYVIQPIGSVPFLRWYEDYIKVYDFLEPEFLKHENWGLSKLENGKQLYTLFPNIIGENLRGLVKENSTDLRTSKIPIVPNRIGYTLWYNLDGFEVHCKQHKAYWEWMELRNEERHLVNENHGKNYDSKNMMHLMRLLEMAFEISIGNGIKVRSDNTQWLLDIKNGLMEYDTLMESTKWMTTNISKQFEMSDLQDAPDPEVWKELLLDFRN